MTDFPGKMSSQSEENELSKHSRITYTRDFLLSLANLDLGKKLPSGIEPSILSELQYVSNGSSQSSLDSVHTQSKTDSERRHDKLHPCLLQNSEHVGLLRNGSLLGVCGSISEDSAPKFQDNTHHLLHKSKEPFRPRCLYKAANHSGTNPWDLNKPLSNDETFGSSECLSEKEEQEERMRRDLFEVMTEGQNKPSHGKQKKYSNEHDEHSKFVLLQDDSANVKTNKCEKPEDRIISPASVDDAANCNLQNIAAEICTDGKDIGSSSEKNPTCGISCGEGFESIAHGVSKDVTKESSYAAGSENRLQSTYASSFIQQTSEGTERNDVSEQCKFPFPVDKYFFSSINEYGSIGINCEELMCSSSADQSESMESQLISDEFRAEIGLLVEIDAGLELDPLGCFDGNGSFPIESLLPDEDSLITVDDFRFPPDNESNNMLMPEGNPFKADRIWSSSPADISRKLTNLNIVIEDVEDENYTPLPDEDSLITVDDFRFMPENENNTMLMLEGSSVKADTVSSSSPADVSGKLTDVNIVIKDQKSSPCDVVAGLGTYNSQELNTWKIPARFHQAQSNQGNTSFHLLDSQPAQPHMRSQMNPMKPNYNPHKLSGPSHRPFSPNILPSTFHHSHVKPHQQLPQLLIPGWFPPHQLNWPPRGAMPHLPGDQPRYTQELGPIPDRPLNYQLPNHGCFGMPTPGLLVYGSINDIDLDFNTILDEFERNAGNFWTYYG